MVHTKGGKGGSLSPWYVPYGSYLGERVRVRGKRKNNEENRTPPHPASVGISDLVLSPEGRGEAVLSPLGMYHTVHTLGERARERG